MISKLLSTAIKLWLKSQVEKTEKLKIKIDSGNRQILGGYIPAVYLKSDYVIYQGLHLHQVELQGLNLRINLPQIVKGEALKLLEPVAIEGNVTIEEADLQASLASPLLLSGLTDLLCEILATNNIDRPQQKLSYYSLNWQEILLKEEQIIITGTIKCNHDRQINRINIHTHLTLANSHTLEFFPLHLEGLSDVFALKVDRLSLDLGSEVAIEQLSIESGKLIFVGGLKIMPD